MEKSLKNVRNVENFIIFASKYTLGKLTRVYFKRPFKNTKKSRDLNKKDLKIAVPAPPGGIGANTY